MCEWSASQKKEGALGLHGLRVSADSSPWVSNYKSKSYGFPHFELCHKLLVSPMFVPVFRVFHSKTYIFLVFEVIQSMKSWTCPVIFFSYKSLDHLDKSESDYDYEDIWHGLALIQRKLSVGQS